MLGGHRVTATICAAVELGVIEALAAGERTPQMIATTCATHEPATGRLLAALAALGICEQPEPGKFNLSAVGDHLVASVDRSLRDWALFEGTMLARSWLGLGD
jgi:DNA-binding IclR family transcriptional regulator